MNKESIGRLQQKLSDSKIVGAYENGTDILALEFDDGDVFEIYHDVNDGLTINSQ